MSEYRPENPLIVQGDQSVLAEVGSPRFAEARDRIAPFAELVKSPEHVHTYRITPLSVWNACAAGTPPDEIVDALREYAKYPVPPVVEASIRDAATRYGRLRISRDPEGLTLTADEPELAEEIGRVRGVAPYLGERLSPDSFRVPSAERGRLKQALVKAGWPAEDLAGYTAGEPLPISMREVTREGEPFTLRTYQSDAAGAFHAGGSERGGSGVVVLPCGAGKTVVGMECMSRVGSSTLVLTTSVTAVRQWIREVLDKTTLTEDQVGEYTGQAKDVRPVTVATYQVLTHRDKKDAAFKHLELFDTRDWGLIVYDEVHLLPAPVFQVTAALQARRRLGLTATLVREDGREDDVFALIGPKKAEVPWKVLEGQGWIATAECTEVRVPLPKSLRMPYAVAEQRDKFRIASENPDKLAVIRRILERHPDEPTLVIGLYVEQIEGIARDLGIPVLTGTTAQRKRDVIYKDFREGRIPVLAVSKVANFAVDLPDAAVAIQVSGTFGSRQEEAQRLGRILRPKKGANQAHFYTLVSRDTTEQEFALKRQLFLCEQGYAYRIADPKDI
ncbi:DNA repair helicase XPB [Longimicrobium terrae]|uniref:DNA 3'-5' helicase n=1 Tax=Longimicrobium terrae TaxID=1639882 RepID=A0A841H5Y3_9BACT|nr:DNA repair helicase XPB [Longimicrobium terrae]MBB4639240.1 DNA excision repair protein ERCC-3 [Longimicrobium terrae]MBB6073480.1 DNA excision repair protein ERCC-3 [Longimicrobium terrae]NNC32270.1 DEAD/DEAH box helicase [Longimicrobium terrae]